MSLAPAPARGQHLPALDGLRGLAVALVVIGHYYGEVPFDESRHGLVFLRDLSAFFTGGLELFFVLSGYLITSILLARRSSPNLNRVFYTRRLCRTVPAYLLLLLAFLLLRPLVPLDTPWTAPEFDGPVPWWSYALMVQNVFMATLRDIGPWWLVVTWSLAVEEQFYAFMPWLVRFSRPALLPVLAALSVLLCPWLRWFFIEHAGNPFAALYLLPSRMDALLVGAGLAVLTTTPAARDWLGRQRAWRRGGLFLFGVFYLGGPFLLVSAAARITASTLLGLGFGSLLTEVLLEPESWLCGILENPALLFLGGISYSLYLFHLPVLYTVHALFSGRQPLHRSAGGWAATGLSLALSLLCATLARRWVELPFIRLGRKWEYLPGQPSS